MDFVGIIFENGTSHCLLNDYMIEKDKEIYQLSKKTKVTDFYNNELKSISCIVGENGSGKTRLINDIYQNLMRSNSKSTCTFIIRTVVDDIQSYYLTGKQRKVCFEDEILKEYHNQEQCNIVKFSTTLEGRAFEEKVAAENYDISTTSLLYDYGIGRLTEIDMLNQISFVVNYYSDLRKFNEVKDMKFINIEAKECIMTLSNEGRGILGVKDRYLSEQINFKSMKTRLDIGNASDKNNIITVLYLKFISILISQITILLPVNQEESKNSYERFKSELKNEFSHLKSKGKFIDLEHRTIGLNDEYLENLDSFIKDELAEYIDKYDKDSQFCIDALDCLKKIKYIHKNFSRRRDFTFSLEDTGQKNRVSYEDKGKMSDLEVLYLIVNEFINGNEIEKAVFSTIDFKWNGVSSGEFALLNLFGRIYSKKNKLIEKDILFLVDEVDLGLHPEWQRLWIHIVPYFLKKILSGKEIQLIITTHSPIVLSDFTKNNVILIGEHTIEEETFGQNIYTLMVNGLFLKNTIGEYANIKINKIIADLEELSNIDSNSGKQVENLKNRISLLGDELVRRTLMKKLTNIENRNKLKNYQNMTKEELIARLESLEGE
ncbi:hypothetical protein BAU15_01635 [Enterococcus sp. JM4C]|uniref:AAA family ATPase n=1 Tax=Candidatus Enterococcus huntleyi TaxID=1857217 RepID=UPI00137AD9C4|nr:AAA family ATPase [Enterococcus sp. JM4C]KAF1299374.1 hypothetical protein BAU15_01635 [Enterococcus sp. JM4C]